VGGCQSLASGHMNGEMVLVGGETCPARMPSPLKSAEDIENNQAGRVKVE